MSVSDIISHSSNIGVVKIAFDLSYPLLNKTIKKMGFGKKTGIELPGESRGIYKKNNTISDLSLSNLSFGQGIANDRHSNTCCVFGYCQWGGFIIIQLS